VADLVALLTDLGAESGSLDDLVAVLGEAQWQAVTPAPGWRIAHQIAHLAWTDEISVLAATEPDAFRQRLAELADESDPADRAAALGAEDRPEKLLARWRSGRARLSETLRGTPSDVPIPWFGPPMRATSMATARIMETFAHGQDVADTLGLARGVTPRLRHVAHIGVRTRDFAFRLHGDAPPAEEFRIELAAEGGAIWTWGPADAAQRVSGKALDFCLLVTQRRHRDDLDVRAQGADAERWLSIAQAFAGAPGKGRQPGRFDRKGNA
jgi:uncharacterized protein (TIGR03084 family)